MSATSISQFDLRLINQQRQIYNCVFRLFDSSKYLTTLKSNISRCQKATTLILIITLYNPLFHLWKSSKNLWALRYFCRGCLLKSATATSFSQLNLSRNSCSRRSLDKINLYFLLFIQDDWSRKGLTGLITLETFSKLIVKAGVYQKRAQISVRGSSRELYPLLHRQNKKARYFC